MSQGPGADQPNPFASPAQESRPQVAYEPSMAPTQGNVPFWDGEVLVVPKNWELPPKCLRCGQPAYRMSIYKLSYTPPWVYILLLCGLLPLVIVALIVSKSTKLKLGVCEKHLRQRQTWLWIGLAMIGAGILAFVCGPMFAPKSDAIGLWFIGGLILIVLGLGMASSGGRPYALQSIDDYFVRLKRVPKDLFEM